MAGMKHLLIAALAAPLLAACSTTTGYNVAPEGSLVALGHPVAVADLTLTPRRVTEDSRCPMNARCVWAGRIVVETQIDGTDWQEVVPLTLGERSAVRGYFFEMVSAEPSRMAGSGTDPLQPEDYRFAFEGSAPNHPPE